MKKKKIFRLPKLKLVWNDFERGTEVPPSWYGFAYRDFARRESILFLIPLNLVVRWWRDFTFWLHYPLRVPINELPGYRNGYQAGYEAGKTVGALEAQKKFYDSSETQV